MGIAKLNQNDFVVLKQLVESGQVVPVIDRRYPFSEAAEAFRYAERGHSQGKVVLNLG